LFNFFFFFFLDKKETKNQESLIAPHGLDGIAGFQGSPRFHTNDPVIRINICATKLSVTLSVL